MALVLTHFKGAIQSLRRGLEQPKDEFTRDAVIQRFEFTYELAWKLIQRALVVEMGLDGISGIARRELFRHAAQMDLIEDPVAWFEFHEARNIIAHTYNESAADLVYLSAQKFLPAAEFVLESLTRFESTDDN